MRQGIGRFRFAIAVAAVCSAHYAWPQRATAQTGERQQDRRFGAGSTATAPGGNSSQSSRQFRAASSLV